MSKRLEAACTKLTVAARAYVEASKKKHYSEAMPREWADLCSAAIRYAAARVLEEATITRGALPTLINISNYLLSLANFSPTESRETKGKG